MNLYYLLHGDVEKVRYYSFHGGGGNDGIRLNKISSSGVHNSDSFSLKNAL